MTTDKFLKYMETLIGGIIVAEILIHKGDARVLQKPREPEPPIQFEHLAPPGSHAVLHDNSISWHGDQLHIPGYEWL